MSGDLKDGKRTGELDGWPIGITRYRVGDRCVVVIDNVDPGAPIARAEAESFETAEREALATARKRLATAQKSREALRALHESVEKLEQAVNSKR